MLGERAHGDTDIRLLGPLEIVRDGASVPVGGTRRRTLLAVLLVHRNDVVSVDRLVDEVWLGDAPAQSRDTLQSHLAHLRRALAGGEPDLVIERKAPGYTLRVPEDHLDVSRFEHAVEAGRRQLAGGDAAGAAAVLTAARDLWVGAPLDGVYETPSVQAERARLQQLRRDATEEWAEANLRLGRAETVIPVLEELLSEDAWRERATAQLMTALYQSGRQVDALATYQRLRTALADELGLVPSPDLRALESEILRHVPAAEPPPGDRATELRQVAPFVGRDAELGTLVATLRRVTLGGRAVALVRGEPGAGKTRLVRELALSAAAQGVTVLSGRCDEEPLAPYGPFLEAISGYVERAGTDDLEALTGADLAELSRAVPRLADRLPSPAPTTGGAADFERLRFFEAINAFLRAVAPAVFIVDDLHCADPGSLVLLRHVLRSSDDAPLFFVATTRVGAPGTTAAMTAMAEAPRERGDIVNVALAGLDAGAVATLVGAALHDVTEQDAGTIAGQLCRATDGNPFFVRELLRDLTERGGGALNALVLPPTVRDAIAGRVSQLAEPVREGVGVAAVVGEEFDLDVLTTVLGIDEDDALRRVEAAAAAGVVVETATVDRFRFAHALVRQFLLDELSASRRTRLHHLAGIALQELRADSLNEHLGELAYHFAEAAKVADASLAVTYARRAGGRAMGLLAYEEAAQHFRRALDGMGFMADADDASRCDLLLRLGDALNRAGDTPEAEGVLASAGTLALRLGDPVRLARAALDYGGDWTRPGGVDAQRVALLEQSLSHLDSTTHAALRARVMARLAEALAHGPDPRAAELGLEAVEAARHAGDDQALAAALHATVSLLFDRDHMWRLAGATELVALAERLGDADLLLRAQSWQLLGLLEVGDAAAIDATLKSVVAAAAELRQPLYEWGAAGFEAMSALLHGEFDAAEQLAGHAMNVARRAQAIQAEQNYVAQMVAIRYCQGRLAEIAPVLGAVAASPESIPAWRAVNAWVAFQLGDAAAARDAVAGLADDDFEAIASGPFWSPGVALAGEVCAAVGTERDAARLYDRLLPKVNEAIVVGRASVCLGAAARYLGLLATRLGQFDAATAHYERALAFNDQLDARPFVALTQYDFAQMLVASHATRARALARSAAATATALGMHWLADRAAAL